MSTEEARATATTLLLTCQEVADELRVHRNYVYELCNSGELRSIKLSRGARRIARAALEEYIERQAAAS